MNSETAAGPDLLVIGGANLDIVASSHAALVLADSNPGHVHCAPGGVARNVASPTLAVLGVTVTTNASTQFRDTADAPITATQFFAQAANHLVKVRGSLASGSFVADQVELED